MFLRVATFLGLLAAAPSNGGESSIKRKAERLKAGEPGGKTKMHRRLNMETAVAAEPRIESQSRLPAITPNKLTEALHGKMGE